MENKNAHRDYVKAEKLMPSRIKEVRALLKDKHGLDVPHECNEFIARCLRTKDGALDKTAKLVVAFRQTIIDFEKWDAKLQPTLFDHMYNSHAISGFLQRDREGHPILYFTVGKWDVEKMNFDEAIFACWMMGQYLVADSMDVQRNGFAIVFDLSNTTLRHAWAMKHWRLLSLAMWMQSGIAGRIKAIHVVFHSKIIRTIYAAVKPFLKEKMKKRIMFHDNLDCLHEYIDPKGLPDFLGGKLEPSSDDCIDKHFMKRLLQQDAYFKDMTVRSLPTK